MAAHVKRTAIKSGLDEYNATQAKRRQDALARQRAARHEHQQLARQLLQATEAAEVENDTSMRVEQPASPSQEAADVVVMEVEGDLGSAQHHHGSTQFTQGKHPKAYFASQFMHPEWLTAVPEDLGVCWYVLPRPEGHRCLVTTHRGWTISRLRSGAILHKFQYKHLPGGAPETAGGPSDYCVLDCIYHEGNDTYHIQDLIAWRGYELADCSYEFRMFWLLAKLQEEGWHNGAAPGEPHAFQALPVYKCDIAGLQAAYQGPVNFVRDGICFVHKELRYEAGDVTPLMLVWKDELCSRYLLDTDKDGVVLQQQQVILEVQQDMSVATSDKPPVVLGSISPELAANMGSRLRPGRILRYTVGQGGLELQDGVPVAADLLFEGFANQRRGRADTFSKIMFQYIARRHPISVQQLVEAITRSCSNADQLLDGVLVAGTDGAMMQE